ncbi:MAG: guanylate kinase [Candidatus Altimarinota bacterium]
MSNQETAKRGLFIAICGPSGVGKGTIMKMLKQRFEEALYVLSHTTREIRPGEKEGEVYFFISKEEFQQGIEQDRFLEWAQVHKKDYYGILKEPVLKGLEKGRVVIREVDLQGVRSIKKVFDKKDLVTIMILPENLQVLKDRIAARGKLPEEEVQRRLDSAKVEMLAAEEMDYRVYNIDGKIEECYEEVKNIIDKESQKRGI